MPPGRFRVRRVVLWSLLLLVVAYLVWGWIESTWLSRDIVRIRQRGEPVDVDAWRESPRTDEQRRAAELYAAAVGRAQEIGREEGFRFQTIDVDRVAPAANLEELESTYRKDTPALQFLDQATPLDFGGFGTIAPELYSNTSPLATLGALNALRADLLARRGEGDAAVTALVGSVRLKRTLQSSFSSYQRS